MSPTEQTPTQSEPEYAKASTATTKSPFYSENIDRYLTPETQELFEKYSKIPPSEQSKHVHEMRDKAWAIRSYPCTGLGVWLIPYISLSPAYSTIITRLKAGETFMDVGSFLGMDMRRLAFDGAPTSQMYGIDIVDHWNVGYDTFRDKAKFEATFVEADLMSDNAALAKLKGKVDVISVSAVLHQWEWDGQVKAAKKLVEFSKSGSIIVGHQLGHLEGGPTRNEALKVWTFRQNPETFKKLWDQVGKETGTTWETEAWLRTWDHMGWEPQKWLDPGTRVLDFVVTRSA